LLKNDRNKKNPITQKQKYIDLLFISYFLVLSFFGAITLRHQTSTFPNIEYPFFATHILPSVTFLATSFPLSVLDNQIIEAIAPQIINQVTNLSTFLACLSIHTFFLNIILLF
jgi:hypothetical protein